MTETTPQAATVAPRPIPEPSRPVGRPTLYDPAYCEAVINDMAEGAGLVDDVKLHVAGNKLTLKADVTGNVQHTGDQVLPCDFIIFPGG